MSEPAELDRCGIVYLFEGHDRYVCGLLKGHVGNHGHELDQKAPSHEYDLLKSAHATIANLRAALAEATKLSEHNAEAARILCHVPDTVLLGLNGGAEWPAFCAWAIEHARLRTEAEHD